MKILMVVSWYSPKDAETLSAGVFHYEQAMALKKYADVALFFPYDQNLDCEFSKETERGLLTWRSKKLRWTNFKGSWLADMMWTFRCLQRICTEYQPDIIHAQCGALAGRDVLLFAKLYGYPVVITEHSPIEQMQLNSRSGLAQLKFAYGGSAANVCVSGDSMSRLREHFPRFNFQVIYNGIQDPNQFDLGQRYYAIPGKINCGIVALFYSLEIKGYQFLLPALKRLKDMGKEIVLHICGGGDYLEHYQKLAQELDIMDCCIFYGHCSKEKVYSIVSQMDFNISASIYECSGVSVEEALLLGKPMLVTRSGGANSLVTEKNAIVVDRGSVDALVSGILEMTERLPQFNAEEIKEYAYENFEIDHVTRQYMQLFDQILENRNAK